MMDRNARPGYTGLKRQASFWVVGLKFRIASCHVGGRQPEAPRSRKNSVSGGVSVGQIPGGHVFFYIIQAENMNNVRGEGVEVRTRRFPSFSLHMRMQRTRGALRATSVLQLRLAEKSGLCWRSLVCRDTTARYCRYLDSAATRVLLLCDL